MLRCGQGLGQPRWCVAGEAPALHPQARAPGSRDPVQPGTLGPGGGTTWWDHKPGRSLFTAPPWLALLAHALSVHLQHFPHRPRLISSSGNFDLRGRESVTMLRARAGGRRRTSSSSPQTTHLRILTLERKRHAHTLTSESRP